MSETATNTNAAAAAPASPSSKTKAVLTPAERTLKSAQRRRSRKAGREKLSAKLRSDREFAKTYFESRSKRSTEKKAAFRKKKSRKK